MRVLVADKFELRRDMEFNSRIVAAHFDDARSDWTVTLESGAKARSVIKRANGSEEVINSKMVTELSKNDRVVIETAGGGGYGNPIKRSRDQVADDLRNGKVSPDRAKSVYGYETRK